MTCPVAWAPASVRPVPSTGCLTPPERVASAASSAPWTVRAPGCSWYPAKSVPSYSTRARYRPGVAPRPPAASPRRAPIGRLHELDLDYLGGIARALADLHDPGVAGRPIGVFRGDLVERLGHDERLVRELRDDSPARRQVTLLRERDHPLDAALDLLGLRLGRLDPLVAEDRDGQVLEESHPGTGLAAELPPIDAVGQPRRPRPRSTPRPRRPRPRPRRPTARSRAGWS